MGNQVEAKAAWLQLEMEYIWYERLRAFVNPWLEQECGESVSTPSFPVTVEMLNAPVDYKTFQRAVLKLVQRARKKNTNSA